MVMVTDRHLLDSSPGFAPPVEEDAARRALRTQIARLERQLGDALVTGFPADAVDVTVSGRGGPRLLGLGDLEALRDDLAAQLGSARRVLAARAEREQEARTLLESMYADPRRHRFLKIARAELGVRGCGSYEVRPRLGIVGMLMGWWQVKLSSGCPTAVRGEPASYSLPHGPPQPQTFSDPVGPQRARRHLRDPAAGTRCPAAPRTL